MAFRLPPLNTLRIFDAAARQLSFKLAAEELRLTASAVSHAIQTLEGWLDTDLFNRSNRSLSLTTEGQIYAPLVARALNMLADATEALPGRRATGSLSVSCAPTFARRWLMPRLSHFTEQFPDIYISIDTSLRLVSMEDVDVAIRSSHFERPGDNWVRLVCEELVPVCSPTLKSQLASLTKAEILARGPLIGVTASSADWDEWLAATKTHVPSLKPALRVDIPEMAFDAAIHGLGIALGRRPLVNDELESGRLVCAINESTPSGSYYWLVTKDVNFDRPEVKLFRDWIVSELNAAPGL